MGAGYDRLGTHIRVARESVGLSIECCAIDIGMCEKTWGCIERNQSVPTAYTLRRMVIYLREQGADISADGALGLGPRAEGVQAFVE